MWSSSSCHELKWKICERRMLDLEWGGDQEFSFEGAQFEVSVRCPSRDGEQNVGYVTLDFREKPSQEI